MPSAVDICSNALISLGAKAIASFEEGSQFASVAANLWPTVRDALLRGHPWNCATRRVLLAPMQDVPAFDYTHQFQQPSDWLRTLAVGKRGCPIDFRKEGNVFLANVTSLPLVYIWRNENTDTWDSSLAHVAEVMMAAAMAYAVTASTSLKDDLDQEAQFYLKQARAQNGQDEPPEEFSAGSLLTARF